MRLHREDIDGMFALTRQAVKKLREAHELSFCATPTESHITARKKKNDKTTDEFAVETRSTFCDFDKRDSKRIEEVAYCHYLMWYANNVNEHWQGIARFLKPGDRLELHWTRDGRRNEYIRKAGLHCDSLTLVVHRPRRDGYDRFTFLVEVQIGEDNTARLIRRGAYNME